MKDDIPLWDEPHVRQRPAPKVLHTLFGPPPEFFRPNLPDLDSANADSVALMIQSLAFTVMMQRREWLYGMVYKSVKMMYDVARVGPTERAAYESYIQDAVTARVECDTKAGVAFAAVSAAAADPDDSAAADDAINDFKASIAELETVLAGLLADSPDGASAIVPLDMQEFAMCAAGFGGGVGTTTSPPERPILIVTFIPEPLTIASVPEFVTPDYDTQLQMRPGATYTFTMTASGGTPPYSWNAAVGDDSVASATAVTTTANGSGCKIVVIAIADGLTDVIVSCTDSTPADQFGPYMAGFSFDVNVTSPPPPPPPPPPDPPPSPPPPP